MFVMGGREMAGALDEVREVVRATGIEALAGTRAPVTGLLELRGTPVPVVDLRSAADPGDAGDVLVLGTARGRARPRRRPGARRARPGRPAAAGADRAAAARAAAVRRRGPPRRRPAAPVLVVSLPALAGLVPA